MESNVKHASTGAVLVRYWQQMRQHLMLLVLIVVGVIATQLVNLCIPLLMRNLLNIVASHTADQTVTHAAYMIVIAIAIAMILRLAFQRFAMWLLVDFEIEIMQKLVASAYEVLIGHSYHFFSNQFAGTLTRRINKYAEAFEAVTDTMISNILPTGIFVTGAVITLSWRAPILGELLAGWVVIFLISQISLTRMHRPLRVERAAQDSATAGMLADSLTNHSLISVFSAGMFERNLVKEQLIRLKNARFHAWRFMEYLWGVHGLLAIIINVTLLYIAVGYWSDGRLTVGDLILIQTYLMGSVDMLANVIQQLRRIYDALADAGEMVAILDTSHEIQDKPNAPLLTVTNGAVEFSDVSFSFHTDQPVLSHMSVSIAPGQRVALVGPSGAGKSTITKLVLRLYDVKAGAITIDGQNIADVTQDSLREHIGFVPQEPILFHRTLMENIRYGKRDATDDAVIEAAKQAYCHEFISRLPQGYDTLVGERGIKLSGGERQRVAIARAILKNAPILILDEATSSLDSESEQYIQRSLQTLMHGKTAIVIAHRLSTIMAMDRILVIDNGRVEADGTHESLLAQDGLYKKLWNIQAGGFIGEE